ncbi:MAG: glycosyl hydrolase family 88 [Ruminiclostridium sp.]|nr:glycosyl hydrolase family 88 [Ruminiclostridium sp.]
MKICVLDFNKKAKLLEEKLLDGKSFEALEEEISVNLCENGLYAAFISVCDTFTRARVLRYAASSLKEAWHGACNAAMKFVSFNEYDPKWVKADILVNSKRVPLSDVINEVKTGYNEFYRHGLSFDDEMKTTMIEAEMNGNRVISYKNKTIEAEQVNKYLSSACGTKLSVLPENVIVFDCKSAFCDEENNVFELYGEGYNCGRRITGEFNKEKALEVITTSSEYLSMQLDFSGKFEYGIYPVFHNVIPGYNILRHTSSIWSLVCAYRITKDKFILRQIECALGYTIKYSFYKYKKPKEEENTAYILDLNQREVKLGGNAVAIIMLTEYMDVTGTDKYKKLCCELGNGILELLDSETGEFTHVLDVPKLNVKEKMRTVYYDGEAVFALARLYGLTKEERWLNAAKTAVDRFIREDYTKHRDHWVAYSVNELTKYVNDERYFEFGLKNAQNNLEKIYDQKTTYHTYLELLCVTFELYDRIKENDIKVGYLEEFDVKAFVDTIFHRADYMLNGYCYPEYVMYLKYPEKSLGAFFVRHDGYRIRIDDIQHFCGAYYSLYRNYEKLDNIRKQS